MPHCTPLFVQAGRPATLLSLLLAGLTAQAQNPAVISRTPARNAVSAPRNTDVVLGFSQALNAATASNVRVFSSQSGGQLVGRAGTSTTASSNTLTINSANDLRPGETVFVTVPATVKGSTGTAATAQVHQFTAATAVAKGTFDAAVSTGAGTFPIQAASGDINGDGKLDLVASNYNDGTVGVYLGSGNGTLGSQLPFTVKASPYAVALGDLNNDGQLDVVVGSANTDASVLLNTGTSALFGAAGSVTIGANAQALALGDVNNDGNLDLVAGQTNNGSGTTIRVLLGNGNGTFGAATIYTTGVGPYSITLADFNNDGYLDILAPDYNNTSGSTGSVSVSVLLNKGAGTFGTRTGYTIASTYARRAVAADFNNDGNLDIAVGGGGALSVLLGTGTGSFGAYTSFSAAGNDLTAGDINGDGNQDIVTSNNVLLGNGQGSFTTGSVSPPNAYGLALADFNNDGRLDIASANGGLNTVSLLLGQAPAPTLSSLSPSSGPVGTSVIIMGTNFTSGSTVSFNGRAATNVIVNSATQITATVPTGTTTGNVRVTSTSGSSNNLSFAVISSLTISSGSANSPISIATGTYNTITVTSTGYAQLGGAVQVSGPFVVQGSLVTDCQTISGSGNFTLASGATLGICDAAGISTSDNTGAVQVTGTRLFSPAANYLYNGTVAQRTGSGLPSQVRSLATTNATTLTLTAPTRVAQTLTVGGAGNFDLNGQALTLLSDATGSALVVNAGTGLVSGGTATVQRYLDPAFNTGMGYRHYSAPVSGSTVADLATPTGFAPAVNASYNTSAAPGTVTPFPTVFGYDQSRLASTTSNYPAFDKGFYSPSDQTDELVVGQGYAVQIGADQLVDFTGQLNTGPKTLTLGRNAGATAPDAGWALVGNPYPAPLDWSQVAPADRANLDGSIYVVQSTGPYAGSYRAYVNNLSTSGTNSPLIGTGQGFFVRVSAGQTSGALTFRNSQRVTDYASQAPVYRLTADLRPLVRLELRTSAGQVDGLAVYAEAGATPSYDAQYDAGKLVNSTGLNLASLSATQEPLAIDGRPAFTAATVVPLTVGVPAAGTYALAAAALANLPAGLDAYLTDAQTGQTVRLGQQSTYSFSVTAAEATALLTGRFTLSFKGATPLATAPALAAIEEVALYPNPASDQFRVLMPAVAGASRVHATLFNALGQVVRRQAAALPTTGATLTVETVGLPAGVYTLRLQAGATTVAKRVIIK